MNYKETRQWGMFENLLDTSYCKVKEIKISPSQAPSYQYHHRREEFWIITQGTGMVTLDDVVSDVKVGDVVHVKVGCKHRIRNIGKEDLTFIEVQLGEYFGEDDIIRLKDDYGRVSKV